MQVKDGFNQTNTAVISVEKL